MYITMYVYIDTGKDIDADIHMYKHVHVHIHIQKNRERLQQKDKDMGVDVGRLTTLCSGSGSLWGARRSLSYRPWNQACLLRKIPGPPLTPYAIIIAMIQMEAALSCTGGLFNRVTYSEPFESA